MALRNESHKNAHKVAYMPLTRGKIAVCADAGLTIWGLKDVGEAEEQKWYVEKVVKGSFSTMSFSRDGRLIALGSFYSAAISVYDTRIGRLYTLPGIHSTVRELMWTPRSRFLLAACTQSEFRVFEADKFGNERWSGLENPVGVWVRVDLCVVVFRSRIGVDDLLPLPRLLSCPHAN